MGNKRVQGNGLEMPFQSTKRVLDTHVFFEQAP